MRLVSTIAFAGLIASAVLATSCDEKTLGEQNADNTAPPTNSDPHCWKVDLAITDLGTLERNLEWGGRSIGALNRACADTATREARRKLEKRLRDHDLRPGPELPGFTGFMSSAEATVTRILASAATACDGGAQAQTRIAAEAAMAKDFQAADLALAQASSFLAASCGPRSGTVLTAPANTQTKTTDTRLKPEEASASGPGLAAPESHPALPHQ